jgi:Sec-independent protein secretion pathway component TatC
MDVQDAVLFAIGVALGYYAVSHYRKVGKAY